eukprot:GHVS01073777.1.p1 GENE.GHVS01073777.1~~GHVS01073777.1.p1  ORF type:complete len:100 (+),score=10.10 GHVS01073777.1:478-777(+)
MRYQPQHASGTTSIGQSMLQSMLQSLLQYRLPDVVVAITAGRRATYRWLRPQHEGCGNASGCDLTAVAFSGSFVIKGNKVSHRFRRVRGAELALFFRCL